MDSTILKAAILVVVLVFIFFVSDLRKKRGMVPIMDRKALIIMKLCYVIASSIIIYTALKIQEPLPTDAPALIFMVVGTALVAKAKIDLSASHTWAGYGSRSSRLVAHGIYSWMRHPLYTGVLVFLLADLSVVIPRASWYVIALFGAALIYVVAFMAITASRESLLLEERFGEEFVRYRSTVHPFLPLRAWRPTDAALDASAASTLALQRRPEGETGSTTDTV